MGFIQCLTVQHFVYRLFYLFWPPICTKLVFLTTENKSFLKTLSGEWILTTPANHFNVDKEKRMCMWVKLGSQLVDTFNPRYNQSFKLSI